MLRKESRFSVEGRELRGRAEARAWRGKRNDSPLYLFLLLTFLYVARVGAPRLTWATLNPLGLPRGSSWPP